LPLFDELADPLVVSRLAADAEAAGWCEVVDAGVSAGRTVTGQCERRAARRADRAMSDLRVTRADLFDAEIHLHNERFRAVAAIDRNDRVLDIGCGTGESTRQAARVAADGSVLGVDISAEPLVLARRISADEGLTNIAYEQADAQTHPFPPRGFDVCIGRFGVMFFADLLAAFTNIGRALRTDGRLVLLVWQQQERNEWSVAVREAIGSRQPPAAGLDPFTLGDPSAVEAILGRAGFVDVKFTDVHEPVCYGPDVATASELVLGLRDTKNMLTALDPHAREHAVGRLRALLAAHQTDGGVLFDSRAWIITARRIGATE
jgi:SAM-dependent methyltransferase